MGYSLSWLAIKGKPRAAVLEELGFRATGERQEEALGDFAAAELPDGWYLIISNRSDHVAPDSILESLTVGGEGVTCFVEEHVMVSSASGWRDGHKVWWVKHNAQKSIEDLEAGGELPPGFNSICERWRAKQLAAGGRKAGVDYIFEIPAETAKSLTGYRHDGDIPGAGNLPFEVLAFVQGSVMTKKPSFWKKLFGA